MEVLISSRNPDKIREIKEILCNLYFDFRTISEFPDLPELEEDKDTLLGNAKKKAEIIAKMTGITTIADDTGLFVDALGGRPGVFSARYAGAECSYQANREKVLTEMKGQAERYARFMTVVALVTPAGEMVSAEGVLEGTITDKEIGTNGFGYDSIFLIPQVKKTLAEMTSSEKNSISHRGKALRNLVNEIENSSKY